VGYGHAPRRCDVNCCCDPDCSDSVREATFTGCLSEGTELQRTQYCVPANQVSSSRVTASALSCMSLSCMERP